MHDRTEWLRGAPGPKTIKGRTYQNLVEFSRQCKTCSEPFSIFVTSKIAAGHADSNSFGLKNCPTHRRNAMHGDVVELDQLRMANNVMKQELEGLYARDKVLFAEVQALKARLSKYEVPLAPAALNTASYEDALVALRTDPSLTFPWSNG